jgi:NAD(P)-dependent dehydrogenase (short-subunit alcohol dehydrogenase family)
MAISNGTSSHGRLQGKVALVTGGGQGIGEAISRKLAGEGAAIVIADFNPESGAKVVESLRSNGITSEFVAADVTKRADWDRIAETITAKFGHLDILVNNAGTAYEAQSSLTVSEAAFDKVYAVNVKSIFHSVQAIFPLMINQSPSGGSVINISSIAALRPRGKLVWYNSSKAAVSNATKALAHEFGAHGIRCNAVCPVLVPTQLANNFVPTFENTEEGRKKAAELFQIPLGRLTTTEDVANTVLWLSSDESSFITGMDHSVDGGRSI